MSAKNTLSLDEFAVAPRKSMPMGTHPPRPGLAPQQESAAIGAAREAAPASNEDGLDDGTRRQDARKALRQLKRDRSKGASHFVNVHLDRDMKRRLKLAAFTTESSMQTIMENAIRAYLDAQDL